MLSLAEFYWYILISFDLINFISSEMVAQKAIVIISIGNTTKIIMIKTQGKKITIIIIHLK